MIHISYKDFIVLIRESNTAVSGYNDQTGKTEMVIVNDYKGKEEC